jgi:hypothetical protein
MPGGRSEVTCPVGCLQAWLAAAEITAGPLFRKVNRGGTVESGRLSADTVRQILLKRAAQAGIEGTWSEPVTQHGLRRRVSSPPPTATAYRTRRSWVTHGTAA